MSYPNPDFDDCTDYTPEESETILKSNQSAMPHPNPIGPAAERLPVWTSISNTHKYGGIIRALRAEVDCVDFSQDASLYLANNA